MRLETRLTRRTALRQLGVGAAGVFGLAIIGCGDDDDDDGEGTEGTTTTTAEEPEGTATPPAGEGTEGQETPAQGEPAGEEVRIDLSAENIEFDKDEITVPAGSRVIIEFTNKEAVPHNFAAYESGGGGDASVGPEIFVGEVITGPDETITYQFDAPQEPGTYFYRCDVHPVQMTGDLIVE